AGDGQTLQHALLRAQHERLLADARHQEDVVVDAERHQEHEDQQRHAGIDASEAEDVLEHQDARAQRREIGQDDGQDQQPGARTARSSPQRISSTTNRIIGTISWKSLVAERFASSWIADCPPTSAPGPAAALTFARKASTASNAGGL